MAGVAIVAVVVAAALVGVSAKTYGDELAIETKLARVSVLNERLQYYDEVLTMSARMFAATGDPVWMQRYLDNEGPLNATLEEAISLAPDSAYVEALARTDGANVALILMEKESFALTAQGNRAAALAQLTGDDYLRQKAIYKQGNDEALDILTDGLEAQEAQAEAVVLIGTWAAGATMLLAAASGALCVTWILRARTLRRAKDAADALNRAHEANAFKTRFLNSAAHELATPLTPIKLQMATMKMVLAGTLSEAQNKSIELLERNLKRLDLLVKDLMDAARLQSGQLRLAPKPTDARELVQDVHASFADKARQDGIDLAVEIPDGPMPMTADAGRLTQVLYNLVHNALKFTPRGGLVVLRAEADDARVRFMVRDSGIGMTTAQRDRLFEPFTQVHDQDKLKVGGTGLGLYISRTIALQTGGTLQCSSDGAGQGTTFVLDVPRTPPPPAAAAA